jgi:hypothetical protein
MNSSPFHAGTLRADLDANDEILALAGRWQLDPEASGKCRWNAGTTSSSAACNHTPANQRKPSLLGIPERKERMPLAASTYTFGDSLLTVLEIAFLFLWIWIAVGVVFDIFRSHDLSNWAKALWVLFIFAFPLIGVLGYLIVRGHTLHEHQAHDRAHFEAFRQFTRGGTSRTVADDVGALADLRDRGVLTDEEFERAKARTLQ